MTSPIKARTLTSLLGAHSHITLCPISCDTTKESNINFGIETGRLVDTDAEVICWYGDRKSPARVGELFGIVKGYSKPVDDPKNLNVVFFLEVVAVLSGEYTPSDWVNPKSDRTLYVLKQVQFASSWCDLNEALGHSRTHLKHGTEYTPFLAGMSRRRIK